MAKINEIDITSLTFQEGSAPTTPASTKWKLYTKTDGLYFIDDAGTETGPLAAGGGSGAVTFLNSYTPAAASEVDIALTAGYGHIMITGNLVGSASAQLRLRLGDATIDTGTNYDSARQFGGDSSGSASQDGADHALLGTISTADEGTSFVLNVTEGYDSNTKKCYILFHTQEFDGASQFSYFGAVKYMADDEIDLLRLYPASGTITGTVYAYGFSTS